MDNDSQASGYESGSYQAPQRQQSHGDGNRYQGNGGGNSGGGGYRGNNSGGGSNYQSRGGNNFRGGPRRDANQAPRDFSVDPPTFYRPYAITGNEDISEAGNQALIEIRNILDTQGYTVRTSGMKGPQKLFLEAKNKELILPWREFDGLESKFTFTTEEAKFLAQKTHPAWDKLPSDAVKTIVTSVVRCLCGQNLKSPAQFMITWSADGCEDPSASTRDTGRIQHALAVAYESRIPIFNFARSDAKERLFRQFRINA